MKLSNISHPAVRKVHCPNAKCPENGKVLKRGYFLTKWNAQPVRRYQCKSCLKSFSSHTFLKSYRQKKPYLNKEIFEWYSSGTTQRRMARVLRVSRTTVVRKFLFLATLAYQEHLKRLGAGHYSILRVQFDEMETFEHTRLKPLSIGLAVCADSGKILATSVSTMNAKGHLAPISLMKYGYRVDTREAGIYEILSMIRKCSGEKVLITCDKKTEYKRLVKEVIPKAILKQVRRIKKVENQRRNVDDELFRLNHTAAKLRHDLSRLMRKTWVTTKKAERLKAHLDLYIAYNNRYKIVA